MHYKFASIVKEKTELKPADEIIVRDGGRAVKVLHWLMRLLSRFIRLTHPQYIQISLSVI